MFNLIPVVMLLLVQGVGSDGLTLRQQQALLDIAHRAHAVQTQGELESELRARAGVAGANLAFWVQFLGSVGIADPHAGVPTFEPGRSVTDDGPDRAPNPGWSASVRPRDGPTAV